jgi:hypothetical protein
VRVGLPTKINLSAGLKLSGFCASHPSLGEESISVALSNLDADRYLTRFLLR